MSDKNSIQHVAAKVAVLASKPTGFPGPYEAGYDAGKNGSNTVNTNFRWFRSPDWTRQWERGNQDGLAAKGK